VKWLGRRGKGRKDLLLERKGKRKKSYPLEWHADGSNGGKEKRGGFTQKYNLYPDLKGGLGVGEF